MFLKSFNIYLAKVTEKGFTKNRPVIVLDYKDGKALCFKVTSKFARKRQYIRHNYCILRNWSHESLRKPSYVDMNSTVKISKRDFIAHFGYLSHYDFKKVVDFGLRRY